MLAKKTEPSLRELINQPKQPIRWKDGMAQLMVARIRKKTRPDSPFRKHYIGSMTGADYVEKFITKDRDYEGYNQLFRPYLKKDILELLCDMTDSHKNRSLRILDDGAGFGYFLRDIKLKLAEKGIKTKTTAMALEVHEELKSSNVDVFYEGSSVMVIPEEKQDVIISRMGTLWYQTLAFNKEIILKHAYSLVKGGYLLLMTCGFASNVESQSPFMKQEVKRHYEHLKKTLDKRGFEAIYADDAEGHGILIAKRRE